MVLSPSPFCPSLVAVTTLAWLYSRLGFLISPLVIPSQVHSGPPVHTFASLYCAAGRALQTRSTIQSSLLVRKVGNIYPYSELRKMAIGEEPLPFPTPSPAWTAAGDEGLVLGDLGEGANWGVLGEALVHSISS